MRSLIAVLACLTLATACGGEATRSPAGTPKVPTAQAALTIVTTTPASTPSSTATAARQDGCLLQTSVCDTAAAVLKAVKARDLEWLVQNAQPKQYVCPGPSLRALGGPFPLCNNASAGERRPGYPIAFLESEGAIYSANDYRGELTRYLETRTADTPDAFGPAATELYSIACPLDAFPCRDHFALVFSHRPAGIPVRAHLVLYFESAGSASKVVFTLIGPLLRPEWRDAALRGGQVAEFPTPEGWPPLRILHRLPPS